MLGEFSLGDLLKLVVSGAEQSFYGLTVCLRQNCQLCIFTQHRWQLTQESTMPSMDVLMYGRAELLDELWERTLCRTAVS